MKKHTAMEIARIVQTKRTLKRNKHQYVQKDIRSDYRPHSQQNATNKQCPNNMKKQKGGKKEKY